LDGFGRNVVKSAISDTAIASGLAIGGAMDSAIGFADGGLLIGLGGDVGKKLGSDMNKRLTSDDNTSPDRIKYFGDPISALDFNATTVMPSLSFRWKNSAHSYRTIFIKDAVPIHDVEHNPVTPSGNDEDAEILTE